MVIALRGYTEMGTEVPRAACEDMATDFSQRAWDAHSGWSRHRANVDLAGGLADSGGGESGWRELGEVGKRWPPVHGETT